MKDYLNLNFDLSKYVHLADELPLWSAPFGLKLLEFIDYKLNITALDIGFGTGFPLTELAMRLGETSTVYGIDPWKDAVTRAKQKIDFYEIKNIRIIEGAAESIPLDKDSVDLIVSNNGINNVENMDKVISECSRILKTGGQFTQTFNLDKSMFEFYDQLENVLSEMHLNDEIRLMYQHISQKRRPLPDIISLLQKHGFLIRNLEHDQFNYRFSNGTALLNHYFIRLAFMTSWVKFLPADKLGEIFNLVESRLNEQSEILRGLKLSIPYVLIDTVKL